MHRSAIEELNAQIKVCELVAFWFVLNSTCIPLTPTPSFLAPAFDTCTVGPSCPSVCRLHCRAFLPQRLSLALSGLLPQRLSLALSGLLAPAFVTCTVGPSCPSICRLRCRAFLPQCLWEWGNLSTKAVYLHTLVLLADSWRSQARQHDRMYGLQEGNSCTCMVSITVWLMNIAL